LLSRFFAFEAMAAKGKASNGAAKTVSFVLALFLTGSANTILTKVLLTARAEGEDGKVETFSKPFFGTVNMFCAMALVMIVYLFQKYTAAKAERGLKPDVEEPLVAKSDADKTDATMSFGKALLLIAPPAFFDLLSMGLMLLGMLFIPASVWQMLRGANIIFAAILTVVVLRRKLFCFHWLGVAVTLLGITVVSVAALGAQDAKQSDDNAGNNALLGVGIVLFAQVIQAAQIILEEQLLNNVGMDPVLIVGVEGLWGLMFCAIIMPILYVLPGDDHGHMEDSVDTGVFLSNSAEARNVVLMYMISVATYNVSGMLVTSALSGVMRVMLEASRTLCIWLFTLFWHYCIDSSSPFGESWTAWSPLQAFGFLILVFGQATYGQKIVWPCLYYPPVEPSTDDFASPGAIRAGTFPSPSPGTVRTGAFASPRTENLQNESSEIAILGVD
jgi:drug/metabolite transporter (DMT)-like permease